MAAVDPAVEDSVQLGQRLASNRPASIDLSLELERQLNNESMPPTPAFPAESDNKADNKRQSLDPHVLAAIIMQLRVNVAEVTKERDGLAALVADAHRKEADLQDALQLMTEKFENVGEELELAKQKARDDENNITLLRNKVEESR